MKKGKPGCESQSQEKLTQEGGDLEAGVVQISSPGRKRKTSQNTCSHGSFFLRVGAIGIKLIIVMHFIIYLYKYFTYFCLCLNNYFIFESPYHLTLTNEILYLIS